MERNSVRTIRWALVAFGMALGIVLVATGATLIGVILLVMAGLRVAMLLTMRRVPVMPAGRRPGELLGRLARNEMDVAATAIGIAPDDLRRAVDDGRTISAVAADAGISSRQVVDAVVRDATAKVDHAVEAGNVAPNRARMVRNRLPHWAERFVLNTPAMLAGTPPRG
jgi:hypothetical protein